MRRLIPVCVSIVLLVAHAIPAAGHHWRNDSALYHADDRDGRVTFHACDLTTKFANAFSDNNSHDVIPTDITVSAFNGCDNVDIRMNDWNYDQTTYYGWWQCHTLVNSDMCDIGHVHMDLNERDYTAGEALAQTCEEIGHSVGLGHRYNSTTDTCMKSEWSARHLQRHDFEAINSHY